MNKQIGKALFVSFYQQQFAHLYIVISNSYTDKHNKVGKFNIDKGKIKVGRQ